MQYMAQLLVSTATMAAIVYGEETLITINTKKLHHVVSDSFLSLTVDPAILLEVARTSSESLQMLAMARTLAPAFLRVAGPDSNYYRFQKAVDPDRSVLSADYTVTELQWMVLNEFAQQAGLHLVAVLGVMDRENGAWSSQNSLELISLSDRLGYNISWQLGYELQELEQEGEEEVSGSHLGQDVVQLRKMLDMFPRYRRSHILGPDITRFVQQEDLLFLKEFFGKANGAISAATWHPHFQNGFTNPEEAELLMNTLDLEGNTLRKSIGRPFNKKALWLAESEGSTSQGRFKDALVWCQRLGAAAQFGAEVLMKKLSVPIMTQQSPEYWVSVLYKSLVGRAVLDTRMIHGNHSFLRVFAHCVIDRGTATPHYEMGAVVVFGVNLMDSNTTLVLKATSWGRSSGEEEVHQYVLTSARDMESGDVLLNNQLLKLNLDGSLPIIVPTIQHIQQSIKVTIPPKAIGFWVMPEAKVRACMTQAAGKRTDFEGLESEHHMQMNWEYPEVNTNFINSDTVGLRRPQRKHSVLPKLSSLRSKRRENKGKTASSDAAENDKRKKNLGRAKRFTPLENGPYVIPGLSVELFNPSQHSIKSRIGTNKRKKDFLNPSGIKLPTNRQSVKNFETDDDYDDDNDFTIKTNVQASLTNPDRYYSKEENKHFQTHQKRAHGTGFAQHDMFLTTGTGSQMDDFNKDYTYVDDSILDYKADDTESGMVYQDEAQYFHEPGELFEDVKLLPTKQTHQRENFGDLWEVNGFTNRNEQVSKGPYAQTSKNEMISTPTMHVYTPHNLHVKTTEYSPDRYTKNSILMRHISNGNRGNVNSQSLKQILPKYTTQNTDHEFLIHNGGDNMNGRWMHRGEYGEIRRHDLEDKKLNFNTANEVGNVHSRKIGSDVSDLTHTHNSGLEKSTDAYDIQSSDGQKLFTSAEALTYQKENTQNIASKKFNFNEENGSEIPKTVMEVYTKRIMENSSEENDPYILKQQNNIKWKPTLTEAQNYSNKKNKTMESDGENVLFDGDANKTYETDKQNDMADIEEHSIQVMKDKMRSRRDVSAHYKYLPSTHFLNHNKEHGYVVNVEPRTRSSEEPRKYLDDYEDYDSDSRTTLEDLIFTRIHQNHNVVPEIFNRVMADKQARALVKLELRPALESKPLYHNYYTINDIDSKSKFKRDDTKQLQDENLEQPNVYSNRQFTTANVIDYNDKILHLKDRSKKKSENGKSAAKIPDEITSYSPAEVINNGNSSAHALIYKQHVTRQSQHAEKKSFAEIMHFAYTSEGKNKNETQMTDNQSEGKARNSHLHEAETEAVPSYDLTTSMLENTIAQEEMTIRTQETENVNLNRLQTADEEMQTNQPDVTTEYGKVTDRKHNTGNTEKNSTNSLYSNTEDEYNASTINNYISSSLIKASNNTLENTSNVYTETKQLHNNLDLDSSQSSGDFKQSRKRENTNDNAYNRIRLTIPKEDNSKEKMTDMYSFITTLPETAYKNDLKEESFTLVTNNVKDSTMIPNENSSKKNKDALTGAAKLIGIDTFQFTNEATQNSHEKNARNAVISHGNDTSKIDGIKESNREHLVTSSQQHFSLSQDHTVTNNSHNGLTEVEMVGTQDIRSKKDTSNEILLQHANDSASPPAQTSRTMGNTETPDTYANEDKTTVIESRSVSEVTGDAVSYAKSTRKEINLSTLHHKSEESSKEFTSNVNNNVNSHSDTTDKMDTITFHQQKSLHSEDARFKDTSETHESSAGNENGDKEERKDNAKANRFIRMQGETPGTRYPLLDITKRREERIKALNERRAKLRARLLARTENTDNERKDTSHRRKLREALGDSTDIDVSSAVTQNNFPLNSAIMDNVSTEKFNPSASTETFIEQYLLQQQKQMSVPINQNEHNRITDGGYNDTNVWHTEVTAPQNSIKSFHHNTIPQHPWYYYQSPVKAYTSYIMNSIRQAHTADSNTETQKKKHPQSVYEFEGRDDVDVLTAPHEETQNDETKQRLARQTQPLHSNMHYYIHPQTEGSHIFSDMASSSEYPFPSNYDYSKLENSDMPVMTLNYNAHPDIMTDYLDNDLLLRHDQHDYIMEDDQWPGTEKYHGKLERHQLLPLMFEMRDPDIYEEDNIYDPEQSDDVIFDMYYPDYKSYYNVLPNEYMADRSWAEFLHMLGETEVEMENKRELAKLKDKGRSSQDSTEMHSTQPPLLDDSHNKNLINNKLPSSTRYKRSVNMHEITIYPKDANHETLTNINKDTESLPTKDNLQVQDYKAKSIKPTIYKRWYLLKGEKIDRNLGQKMVGDEEWPKYSINKNREDWNNIKRNTPLTKLTVKNRNSYIDSNNARITAKMEDSQQMKSDNTQEEMHVLLLLRPDDQSTDKVAVWKDNDEDKLSMTEPNVIATQPLEDQQHNDFHESHLTDQSKSINSFDNESKVDYTITTKHTKGQTESNIDFTNIIVHAISTIIRLFKEFKLF